MDGGRPGRVGALKSYPRQKAASLRLLWGRPATQTVLDFSLCWLLAGRGHLFLGLNGCDIDSPGVVAKGWQFRSFVLSGFEVPHTVFQGWPALSSALLPPLLSPLLHLSFPQTASHQPVHGTGRNKGHPCM